MNECSEVAGFDSRIVKCCFLEFSFLLIIFVFANWSDVNTWTMNFYIRSWSRRYSLPPSSMIMRAWLKDPTSSQLHGDISSFISNPKLFFDRLDEVRDIRPPSRIADLEFFRLKIPILTLSFFLHQQTDDTRGSKMESGSRYVTGPLLLPASFIASWKAALRRVVALSGRSR